MAIVGLAVCPAWAANANMMGWFPGYGGFPGYMMGGGMGSQFRVADLNGDDVPEIVTIYWGTYLLILDNEGNLKSAKVLPSLPTLSAKRMGMMPWNPGNPGNPGDPGNPTYPGLFSWGSMGMGTLEVADLDGDTVPEIVTTYYGAYLVILDNEGNLKDYKVLPSLTDIVTAE